MADGTRAGDSAGGGGDMAGDIIEIRVKTLESNTFVLQVDKNIPVPALKERIAAESGVPVENQRLICRGRVLKDNEPLSAYNMENGHTLHLVSRHPPSEARGRGVGVRPPQGAVHPDGARRVQQVVMGSIDMTDMGDGMDAARLMSHILNSFGIASAIAHVAGGANQEGVPPAVHGGQRAQGPPAEQAGGPVPVRTGEGTTPPPTTSQALASGIEVRIEQSFAPGPPPNQGGGGQLWLHQIPYPPVVPDALSTTAQFLGRLAHLFLESEAQMEPLLATTAHLAATPNNHSQSTAPGAQATSGAVQAPPAAAGPLGSEANRSATGDGQGGATGPAGGLRNNSGESAGQADNPRTAPVVPRPEHLASLVLLSHNLIAGRVVPSLTRLTQILAREPRMTDPSHRAMAQAAAFRDGSLVQQLGSYLLELGRCIQTVRFGGSPVESYVNAGPAVFVNPLGPSNIMVQQSVPFQAPSVSIPVGLHQGIPSQIAPGHVAINLGNGQIAIPVNLNGQAPPRAPGDPSPPQPASDVLPRQQPSSGPSVERTQPSSAPHSTSQQAELGASPSLTTPSPPGPAGAEAAIVSNMSRAESGSGAGRGEATTSLAGQVAVGQGGHLGERQATRTLNADGINVLQRLLGGGGSSGVPPSGVAVHGMPGIVGGVGIPGLPGVSLQHTTIVLGGPEMQSAAQQQSTVPAENPGSVAGTPGRQWGSALQSGFLNRRANPSETGGPGSDATSQADTGGSAGGQTKPSIDNGSLGQVNQSGGGSGASGGAATNAPPGGRSQGEAAASVPPLGLGMGSALEFPMRRRPRAQSVDTPGGVSDSAWGSSERSLQPGSSAPREGPEQILHMLTSAFGHALQSLEGGDGGASGVRAVESDGVRNAGPGVTVFASSGAPVDVQSSFGSMLQQMLQSQQSGGVQQTPGDGGRGSGPSASGSGAHADARGGGGAENGMRGIPLSGVDISHLVSQMAPIVSQMFGGLENPPRGAGGEGLGGQTGQHDGARQGESHEAQGLGSGSGISGRQPEGDKEEKEGLSSKRQRTDGERLATEGNRTEAGSSSQVDMEREHAGHEDQGRQTSDFPMSRNSDSNARERLSGRRRSRNEMEESNAEEL